MKSFNQYIKEYTDYTEEPNEKENPYAGQGGAIGGFVKGFANNIMGHIGKTAPYQGVAAQLITPKDRNKRMAARLIQTQEYNDAVADLRDRKGEMTPEDFRAAMAELRKSRRDQLNKDAGIDREAAHSPPPPTGTPTGTPAGTPAPGTP
jgi:hypothetical protein